MSNVIYKVGKKIIVELEARHLSLDEMAKEVCRILNNEGENCEIKTSGAMPTLLIEGVEYHLTVGAEGPGVLVQNAVLTEII